MSEEALGGWWSFATAGRVVYGRGSASLVGQVVRPLGHRILICTDKNLVAAGLVERVLSVLQDEANLEVMVLPWGEPEIALEQAEACAAQAAAMRPDVIVGLGGGSNMDLAKLVAARLASGGTMQQWATGTPPAATLPVVAIPTTAGTGSEVTSVAVVTDPATGTKVGISTPLLLPARAIVDPAMTDNCPRKVTTDSGVDALTHAIEAYTCVDFRERAAAPLAATGFVGKNPLSDVLALEAIRLLAKSLPTVVANGSDEAARDDVSLAALLAGLAFSSAGTGIVHALQYPLGTLTHTSHGHGNALLLPAAIKHNIPVRTGEYAKVARLLGTEDASDDDAAAALPLIISTFVEGLGIAPSLKSIGVTPTDIGPMAAAAAKISRLVANNPAPIDEAGLADVLTDALTWPANA
ncbi:MAG: iron-containing alcohol dehydrogenase [Bifidobacteriaceae bacterium]|jgi:alcohol dehydrogenase class IV|nr:iron-containing alcohol dehydrogenase [Bifidobacteriaceae bacterium]